MSEDRDICPVCGLPSELCVCDSLSADEQEIVISNGRRKWGKVVTLISFKGKTDANLDQMLTKAKKKVGAGGTLRGNNTVELQGEHKFRMKKFLIDMGYDEDRIRIEE
ncbi:MAG: stress response translation initiation inhibitor YciH [Promethearchaeati archaeon]